MASAWVPQERRRAFRSRPSSGPRRDAGLRLAGGTEIELTPERQALESALGRSAAQLARNDVIDADEALRRLERAGR